MENKKIAIIGILIVAIAIISGVTAYSIINQKPVETIKINDLNIEQDQWGIYNLKGHITPLKDFNYLEARVQIFDANGTVIGQAFSWNMLHPQKDVTIDISKGLGAVVSGTPAYAIVSFYDSAGGKDSLLNFTITFNGTAQQNDTKDTSSADTSSSDTAPEPTQQDTNKDKSKSSDKDKKYSNDDMNKAISQSYKDGYRDGVDSQEYYYYEPDDSLEPGESREVVPT